MQYTLTMVTFDTALKVGGTSGSALHRPMLKSNGFADAALTQFQIEDDDEIFHFIRPGSVPEEGEDEQRLIHDLAYGAGDAQGVLSAGTQISAYHASIIEDDDGNQFHFMFLWTPGGTTGSPIMQGEKHSALIIPISYKDENGDTVWPQFNPESGFTYKSEFQIGTDNPGIPFDPTGPGDPPCFTPGTLIETAAGPVPVERLRPGDLVVTRDHGLQPLRWIGSTFVSARRLDLQPNLRPVLIPAGALAAGIPARDLLVSPQHRVLVTSRITVRMFEQDEVLVAAKHLIGTGGITAQDPAKGVTYLHLLFDRHEVIRSNGAWSESFFVGPQMHKAGDRAIMAEITTLFPQLRTPVPARRMLSGREARQLAMRHTKNRRELVSPPN